MTDKTMKFELEHIDHDLKIMSNEWGKHLGFCCNTCGEIMFATDNDKEDFLTKLDGLADA